MSTKNRQDGLHLKVDYSGRIKKGSEIVYHARISVTKADDGLTRYIFVNKRARRYIPEEGDYELSDFYDCTLDWCNLYDASFSRLQERVGALIKEVRKERAKALSAIRSK